MKKQVAIYLSAIGVSISNFAYTQGFVENALLFSRTVPGGSARVQAIGGTQIALGGDYSSILSNPAGLGMFNRSEATISNGLNFYNTQTNYLNNSSDQSKTIFNIPGLSYVHSFGKGENFKGAFGASLTRTNDYRSTFHYESRDDLLSIIDHFIAEANGYAIDPVPGYPNIPLLDFNIPAGLSYLTYLINPYSEDPTNTNPVSPDDYITYYSELDPLMGETRTLSRSEQVKIKGTQYQATVAFGGNYRDKLFFGANIGLSTLRYQYESEYTEAGFDFSEDALYNPLDYLTLEENIDITGLGVNLTLGAIYRPVDFFQFGFSLATPTYYQLTDTYEATLGARWTDNRGLLIESTQEPIISEYSLTTPLKLSGGVAFFISRYGFIAGDIELVDYSSANYSSLIDEISFEDENDGIEDSYKTTINYRIGTEVRINKMRIRAGYNYRGNPYSDNRIIDNSIKTISGGVGLRFSKYFFDFALLHSIGRSGYIPYAAQYDSNNRTIPVNNKTSITSGLLTFGFIF